MPLKVLRPVRVWSVFDRRTMISTPSCTNTTSTSPAVTSGGLAAALLAVQVTPEATVEPEPVVVRTYEIGPDGVLVKAVPATDGLPVLDAAQGQRGECLTS